MLATPGHTPCSVSYLWRDRLFCGDTIEIDGCCEQTDESNAGQLFDSVTQRIFMLPDETLIFPGHDRGGRSISTVREERSRNRAYNGRSREPSSPTSACDASPAHPHAASSTRTNMRHAECKPAPCRPETLYARLGGEPAIGRLVDRIYHWMQVLPGQAMCWRCTTPTLAESRRGCAFLSGWLGGPERFPARPMANHACAAAISPLPSTTPPATAGCFACAARWFEGGRGPAAWRRAEGCIPGHGGSSSKYRIFRDPRPRPDFGHGARATHPHHGACQA